MSTHRILVSRLSLTNEPFTLDESAFHHAKALRLCKGDTFIAFDGSGAQITVKIIKLGRTIQCQPVLDKRPSKSLDCAPVTLVQVIPKHDKLESIVRLTTELGVDAIHLALSERSVAKPDAKRFGARQSRLTRIASEAAAVAGSADVPIVNAPVSLLEAAARAPSSALKLVCWEESRKHWKKVVTSQALHASIWIVIGPEGGLSGAEIQALYDLNYHDISLGPRILRVDTAAVAAVTIMLQFTS